MKQTAVEWLVNQLQEGRATFFKLNDKEKKIITLSGEDVVQQAKEIEKQQMLEFGSKVTDRWGLTKVEPQYIEDEYNKHYKLK